MLLSEESSKLLIRQEMSAARCALSVKGLPRSAAKAFIRSRLSAIPAIPWPLRRLNCKSSLVLGRPDGIRGLIYHW